MDRTSSKPASNIFSYMVNKPNDSNFGCSKCTSCNNSDCSNVKPSIITLSVPDPFNSDGIPYCAPCGDLHPGRVHLLFLLMPPLTSHFSIPPTSVPLLTLFLSVHHVLCYDPAVIPMMYTLLVVLSYMSSGINAFTTFTPISVPSYINMSLDYLTSPWPPPGATQGVKWEISPSDGGSGDTILFGATTATLA